MNAERLFLLIIVGALSACATSPMGRSQLILFPDSEMDQMGVAAYREMQQQTPRERATDVNDYVQCVVEHVVLAMPDGSAACLYECGQEHPYEVIRFAHFDPSWLLGT